MGTKKNTRRVHLPTPQDEWVRCTHCGRLLPPRTVAVYVIETIDGYHRDTAVLCRECARD